MANHLNIFWRCLLLTATVALTTNALAKAYIPATDDTVVASWPVNNSVELQQARAEKNRRPTDPATAVKLANAYLAIANKPGQSRFYGVAQAALQPIIQSGTDNTQVWLAWAQLLQHEHKFDEALLALGKVTAAEPKNINANLLAARIYLIKDQPLLARQSCLKLLGYGDLLSTSACVLEITSHQPGKLQESYDQLTHLVKRDGIPSDERGPWLAQLLADMSLRLQRPEVAQRWLEPQLGSASVNLLAQWADTQFTQKKYQSVIDKIAPVVENAGDTDDLLLLQLAIAETKLGNERHWQSLLQARVKLREARKDSQHANELARFYLDVNPQPDKAFYWAQLHLINSREEADKQLLTRAQQAVTQHKDIL